MQYRSNITIKNFILLSTSLVALNACLPDDGSVQERQRAASEAKASYYAQSFQNYNNQSLSLLLNSDAWANTSQTMNEGILNAADDVTFASLTEGNAASFIQSAYCRDNTGTNEYHLSWFSPQDDEGNLSLKGLGNGSGGLVSKKINDSFSNSGLSVYDNLNPNTLQFMNGNTVNGNNTITLSAACSTLNIPNRATVVAFAVEQPTVVDRTSTEVVTRTISCPGDQTGAMVESLRVRVNDPENEPDILTLANNTTRTRNDLMNDPTSFTNLGGAIVSNNCFSVQNIASKQIDSAATPTVDYVTFNDTGDTVSQALETNLRGQDCQIIRKPLLNDDGTVQYDGNGNIIYNMNTADFDSCGNGQQQGQDLITRDIQDIVTTMIGDPEIETITAGCGTRQAPSSVTILNKPTSFVSRGAYNGSATLTKTTEHFETVHKVNGDVKPGSRETYKTVTLRGDDINCQARDIVSVSCENMFNLPSGATASGNAPQWETTTTVSGWRNPETPSPNNEEYGQWTYIDQSMNCNYVQERTSSSGCPSGYSGSKRTRSKRTATVTDINASLSWGDWAVVSRTDTCRQQSSGGDGNTGRTFNDNNGNGRFDGGDTRGNDGDSSNNAREN